MPKPVVLVFVAVVLFALVNVFIEQKLSKVSTPALLLVIYITMTPMALIRLWYMSASGQTVAFPLGNLLLLGIAAGAVYFLADYCYIAAYTNGGDLATVTTIYLFFPLVASLIKYIWVGSTPTPMQIAGYIVAVVAVFLVVKGAPSPPTLLGS